MLNSIAINGFKSIEAQELVLKPLTLITGVNSTGKSSVIQSLLLLARHLNPQNELRMADLTADYSEFSEVKNKYTNAKQITLSGHSGVGSFTLTIDAVDEDWQMDTHRDAFIYEPAKATDNEELFYLNANRLGQEAVAARSKLKVGNHGEFLFSAFEQRKNEPLHRDLCVYPESPLLGLQVSRWLSLVTGIKTELKTETINSSQVKVSFDFDEISDLNPFNLGAGVSFAAKIIILCLLAKKGDMVIIENPEIHLHPKSQAALGLFFAFIAGSGIQLIIETHCEHLINKVAYQVYDEKLDSGDVVIHYKADIRTPFAEIGIDGNGEYINTANEIVSFPSGFFDATLNDLLTMR
ncbi:MAG: putative ATPase [Phenylobacterium sp.]|jgi:predicted ATPase